MSLFLLPLVTRIRLAAFLVGVLCCLGVFIAQGVPVCIVNSYQWLRCGIGMRADGVMKGDVTAYVADYGNIYPVGAGVTHSYSAG